MTATTDRPTEAPATLVEEQPRPLGLTDQLGLWANLGISLLIPVTATFLVVPGQSLLATVTAIVVGTVVGCILLGLVARAGAETGVPTMVLLRGLLGRTGSYAPTTLNLLQCVGWATYEVWIISFAAHAVYDRIPRWVYALAAGGVATAMALRPLGSVRLLKRIAVVAVVASSAYFLIEALRRPLGDLSAGSWTGFWTSTDLVIALPVSWIPLVADYSRFSRSGRAAALGTGIGYAVSSAAYFLLGVLALRAYGDAGSDVIGALLAVPAGAVALVILAVDEVDEAFANIYSTATSAQNVVPRADRRLLALVVGGVATALALAVDGGAYEPFLFLIGAVFVPLAATLIVDLALSHEAYDTSPGAPSRWLMLLPWAAGFVAYQLTAPTVIASWSGWEAFWRRGQDLLGISPTNGFSASVVALLVAGLATVVVRRLPGGRRSVRA
ncbi:MAG TPA: cytosine permease [Mycobacteriales bacterium]|nr:cytosine permease [Mycobacteriales bacterium]